MENKEQYVRLPYFGINKLLPYIKPYKRIALSMIIVGFAGGLADIILPLFQKYAIDNYVAKKTLEGLPVFIAIYVLMLVFQVITNAISAYNACKIEMYVGRDMKRASFNHLQTLGVSYYSANRVGYIHSRVMSDTDKIGSLCSWTTMEAVWNCSYIIGAVVVMFILNVKLALCVTAIVPFVAVMSVVFQRVFVKYNRRVREKNSQITGGFNEGITGAKTIKTLVVEDKMRKDFEEKTSEMKKLAVRAGHHRALITSIISFSASLALSIVLWYGGVITIEGVFAIGTLSAFMSYAQGLMEPVQWLISAVANLVNVQVNVERFTRLMETESDVNDTPEVIEKYGDMFEPKTENWEKLTGDVEFKDVSFKYPDGDEYVLKNFNLKVPKGTNVAIVGETGAGKSTLVNLVCRFYEPTSGKVLIDGKDIRERSQLWLHSNIGYVLQTPHLFSGTIADNIRYGNENVTMDDIKNAAKSVSADDFIARMEKGYDSDVGEGGDMLSTGEKQLISFARAILVNPAIFVLDEATASVDSVTEKVIQDAIEKMMKGRTSFVIAHRLSTIRNADIILAVRDGKIVESGNHKQLMDAKGYYYNLYTRQFKDEQIKNSFAAAQSK